MNIELKDQFVKLLAIEGFKISAMKQVSIKLGLHPEYHNIFFPNGLVEAKDYFEQLLDLEMINTLNNVHPLPQKIREKIALALKHRIFKGHIPSIKNAWRTADIIWSFAGDISTDFNYYTKRALLSKVYIASAKYKVNDNSPDNSDTDLFIIKNLNRIIEFAKLKSKIPKLGDIPIIRYFI